MSMIVRWTAFAALAAWTALAQTEAQEVRARGGSGKNPIDAYFEGLWKQLKLKPNARSGDMEFLRRATLDLTGTLPEPKDVRDWIAQNSSRKREQKVEELVASDAFSTYWADRLTSLLVGYADRQYPTIYPLKDWLKESIAAGTPYDRIVHALITAEGSNKETRETAFLLQFLARDRSRKEVTVQVSKVFLGIQLQCAQCHDHPFEPWTKRDFEDMVGFFGRTSIRTIERMENNRQSEVAIVDAPARRGATSRAKFIDGTIVRDENPRAVLASMITAPANLQFARATVNRIWSEFFGRGFVEPVDDFTSKNPPRHEELLNALAARFVESNFDLRALMRTIVESKAYQLSSVLKPKQFGDLEEARENYAVQIVRAMTPEQTFNSMMQAQGLTGGFERLQGRAADPARGEQLRRGFMRNLTATAGTENQVSPAEYNASMQQVMGFLDMTAPIYAGLRGRVGIGRLGALVRRNTPAERVVEELVLATLSRPPEPAELEACMDYIRRNGGGAQAYGDLLFVLMNTNEFFFNH